MALQFPTSPVDGQQVTLNGKVWRYDATKGVWSVPTVSSTQSVALARTEITATAGQTVLNVTYNTSYGVDVSVNGLQLLSTDFTATNGTSITMTEALAAGDQVVVLAATGAPGGVDLTAVEGDIIPATNETQDLGSASNRWRDLYLSGNSIDLGGATITSDGSAIALPAGSSVGSTPLGGVQVYADTDALVASSPSNGALGFVSANNRLYMYTGTGWFNIALINTNPTITQGGLGNYLLAQDGTPTVITLVAEDPEGLPITWSYNAVSLENHATIVQADNVFTITPSTDPAEAGDFTVTFTASDGVNIATDVNVFSLKFLSPLWKYADLSVDSSSTGGLGNSTVVDRSTNAYTVTANGNPIQTAFHPYLDNWSAEFDGSGDCLAVASDTSLAVGTGDFTTEFWFYPTSVLGSQNIWDQRDGSNGWVVNFVSGQVGFYSEPSSAYVFQSSALSANTWYHIAVVRSGTSVTLYIDGVATNTATNSSNFTEDAATIGARYTRDEQYFSGYISNARLIKGTAVYTSTFAPPTEKLTAVSGTSLLACKSNRFIDNSTNDHTITVNGDPRVSAYNPFGQESEYSIDNQLGSLWFGDTDNDATIQVTDGTVTDFGTDDFTIDFWFYPSGTIPTTTYTIVNGFNNPGTSGTAEFYIQTSGQNLRLTWNAYTSFWTTVAYSNTDWVPYQWTHAAFVRNGTSCKIYQNGVEVASATVASDQSFNNDFSNTRIGGNQGNTSEFRGYLSDFRITKGTAVYTSSFTPPTNEVGAGSSTVYLPFDNAGVFDKTGNNYVSDTTETAYTKYNATSTRGLTAGMSAGISSTSTWTVEFWWRDPNNNSFGLLNIQNASNQDVLVLDLSVSYGTMFGYRWGLGQPYTGQSTVGPQPPGGYLFADGWFHVAIVGTGGNAYLYHNGTQIGSRSLSGSNMSSAGGRIVINSNRYVEGLQLFNGLAKYTANFTVPNKEQGLNYQAES